MAFFINLLGCISDDFITFNLHERVRISLLSCCSGKYHIIAENAHLSSVNALSGFKDPRVCAANFRCLFALHDREFLATYASSRV